MTCALAVEFGSVQAVEHAKPIEKERLEWIFK
jgi:hypothetical protein